MTRPGVTSLDDVPVYEIDRMRWPASVPMLDAQGREWFIPKGKDKGFLTPAAPRAAREDHPEGPGAYAGPEYRGTKPITLAGQVRVPRHLRDQTELDLAGLCADPARTYPLRRRTGFSDLVRRVKLDGSPEWDWTTRRLLEWSFGFVALDPRAHAHDWQEPFATAPTAGVFGLDMASNGGLDFSGAGLDFGTPPQPQVAKVVNLGSAPAHPLFTLTGPLARPVIVHLETGRELAYFGDVVAGETVTVNCDAFPARGFVRHARLSSTRGNVAALLPVVSAWPVVDPYSTASFALRGSAAGAAGLRVALRSAWW